MTVDFIIILICGFLSRNLWISLESADLNEILGFTVDSMKLAYTQKFSLSSSNVFQTDDQYNAR